VEAGYLGVGNMGQPMAHKLLDAGHSLTVFDANEACRDKGLPESTARGWFRDDRDGLATRYEAARRMQVDSWADEIVLLANRDDLDANDKRVRIDTLKWLCSKLVPRRYGDRLLMAGDPENPIQLMHKQVNLAELTDEQLDVLDRFCQSLIEAKAS
jgi:NAD binding domain of 6-phosphogluconate dehydrogenase